MHPARGPPIAVEGWPGAIRFAHGSVWVSATAIDERDPRGPSRQLVHRIDPATNAVIATIPLVGARGDAFSFGLADDRAHVWALVMDDLFAIDPATDAVAGRVVVEGGAGRAAGSGDTLWVPNPEATTVTRIDTTTMQVVDRLTTGSSPAAAAVGLDAVWIVDGRDRTLARIDL